MHPVDAISEPMTSMPSKVQSLVVHGSCRAPNGDISVVVMGYGKPMVPNPMFPEPRPLTQMAALRWISVLSNYTFVKQESLLRHR
jgi:hypothetical protein